MASNPPNGDKKTECIKVWMEERLFIDLNRLAMHDDRKLSEYVSVVLSRHCYGNVPRTGPPGEGSNSPD